jgi:hypothetical protein
MKIALLAWGSLLWEPNEIKIASIWFTTGPILPLEFSRVSGNKKLTLVIDDKSGNNVTTFYATSAFKVLSEAVENLRERENASIDNIGSLERDGPAVNVPRPIAEWLMRSDCDAVVWTSSPPNFEEALGVCFSINAALNYLDSLDAKTRAGAIEYFEKTPPQINTPLRTKLGADRKSAA